MFRIFDGRVSFYQWDIDRKLIVKDASIKEVHFANYSSEMAIIKETYIDSNGRTMVDVPNVMLQESLPLNVYAYDVNYTKYEERFAVKARQKPDNYVYTDEEIAKWSELDARIDEIEDKGVSDEKISEAVNSYLAENPIQVPVESVNGKVGAVELTAADVKALPEDTVIPSTVGLASEKYVDAAIAAIPLTDYAKKTDIPSTSGLATEDYVDEAIIDASASLMDYADNVKVDLTGYATEDYVNKEIAAAQLSGGDVDLSGYYTKTETDTAIKTAVDAIEIPEAQDLSNYYTKTETDTAIGNAVAAIPAPDLSEYAKKTDIPSTTGLATETYVDDKVAAIKVPSLDGYATEDYVDEAIANIDIPTSGGSVAVDGKTIIQNEDGTISTAIGGFIEPGEEYYTWEGSAVPSDMIDITNEAADLKDLVSMDGENVYITYTIDGEEYEEQFIIQRINMREAELVNEDEGILFRIILRPVSGKTLTVEFEGEALTALKIVGEEQYNTIDGRFIKVGTGLISSKKITLDDNYVNNLIATYLVNNLPSAEGVSY